MQEVADGMPAPGAVWALASGPRNARRVSTGAAGGLRPDAILRLSSLTKLLGSAATLVLAEQGVLALDDPIARWVPQWAGRRVLRHRHGALDDTVEPQRDVTVRDLLLMGFGLGYDFGAGDDALAQAANEAGIMSSWVCPGVDKDTWVERVAGLPMRHQPGQGWLYQTSFDALTVVLESATGQPVEHVLREALLEPLGMGETGFTVAEDQLHRVPALYFPNQSGGVDRVAPDGDHSLLQPPVFPTLSTGLLSTADDMITFGQFLLDRGMGPDGRILAADAVEALATPALSGPAEAMAAEFLEPGASWGLGAGVDTGGRFGWDGGTGTSLWTDPGAGTSAVLLTRQGMGGPSLPDYMVRFWEAVRTAPAG